MIVLDLYGSCGRGLRVVEGCFIFWFFSVESVLEGEVSLWDVPDVLAKLHENWLFVCGLLRAPDAAGTVESLDYVLCGDPSVPVRLHALNLVFRARKFV